MHNLQINVLNLEQVIIVLLKKVHFFILFKKSCYVISFYFSFDLFYCNLCYFIYYEEWDEQFHESLSSNDSVPQREDALSPQQRDQLLQLQREHENEYHSTDDNSSSTHDSATQGIYFYCILFRL
jgi:hypothetical protein